MRKPTPNDNQRHHQMDEQQHTSRQGVMILAVSLSILTGTLSGPVALHGFNLFNSFSTPFSLILMSFIGLNGEFLLLNILQILLTLHIMF
jgi:hypothetical protein